MTLSGWNYRKSHILINNDSSSYTGYSVRLTIYRSTGTDSGSSVYLGTKCKADFSDLRFTASDGDTLLSYWIESYTSGTSTVVWVKIPTFAAGNNTIYIYYGNSSAESLSSGSDTFALFDDFSGSTLNSTLWNAPSNYSISDSLLNISYGHLVSKSTYGLNYAFGANAAFPNNGIEFLGFTSNPFDSSYNSNNCLYVSAGGTFYAQETSNHSNSSHSLGTADTEFHTWEIARNSSSLATFSKEGTVVCSASSHIPSGDLYADIDTDGQLTVKWVYVRVCATTAPTHSTWGLEEGFGIAPVAAFSASKRDGPISLTVQFTDLSTCSPTSWSWDFGDGNTSTDQSPSHTYSSNGVYTVSLTVTNASGSDTITKSNFISTLGYWNYRKSHIVVNNDSSSYSEYQVRLTIYRSTGSDIGSSVYVGTKCNADFSDLRFTASDGTTYLSYWIESFTSGTSAVVWVKIPTFSAGNNTLYIYYGNSSAISLSSGTDTFALFEDFSGSTLNTTLWIAPTGYSISDSALTISGGSLVGNTSWSYNKAIGICAALSTSVNSTIGLFESNNNYLEIKGGSNFVFSFMSSSTGGSHTLSTADSNTHIWEIERISSSAARIIQDNNLIYTSSYCIPSANLKVYATTAPVVIYWVYIRTCASTDPTHSTWGSEEGFNVSPVADFTANNTEGGIPLTVHFTDASYDSPTSWLWDFGDGESSTEQNPTHIYSTAGTYSVTLTATNSHGSNSKTSTDLVIAHVVPVASFTVDSTSGSCPVTVTFTDSSTNSPTSWLWDFGDGETSTEQNPKHTYNKVGTYSVTLTATGTWGSGSKTETDIITVSATELIGWAYRLPFRVTTYSDDSVAFKVLIHRTTTQYSTFGIYLGTKCKEDYSDIRFIASGCLLNYWIESISEDYATVWVRFPAPLSGDNVVYVYYGKTSATSESNGSGVFPLLFEDFTSSTLNTSIWNAPASYAISNSKLIITEGKLSSVSLLPSSCSISFKATITQDSGNFVGFSLSNSDTKTIDICFNEGEGTAYCARTQSGGSTLLTNLGDTYSGEHIFGLQRGTSSINHIARYYIDSFWETQLLRYYNSAEVTFDSLSAVAKCVAGTITIDYIIVNDNNKAVLNYGQDGSEESIIANFTADHTSGTAPITIHFTDESAGTATAWLWDFGDGTTSTLQNPSHTYSKGSHYTVSLTVTTTEYGVVSKTVTNYIILNGPPLFTFTVSKKVAVIPGEFSFSISDSSTNVPTVWLWNFGDGAASTVKTPSHTYSSEGAYTVSLTATNVYGSTTVTKSNCLYVISKEANKSSTWLNGYRYRKKISYSAATEEKDMVLTFFVHRTWGTDNGNHIYVGKKCTKNFGDIVFTDYTHTPIPSTVVFWNQHTSEIKVKCNTVLPFIYVYYGGSTELYSFDKSDVINYDIFNSLEDRWTQSPSFSYIESTAGISPCDDTVMSTTYSMTSKSSIAYDDWEIGLTIPLLQALNYGFPIAYSLGITGSQSGQVNLWFGDKTATITNPIQLFSEINSIQTLIGTYYPLTEYPYPLLLKLQKIGTTLTLKATLPYWGEQTLATASVAEGETFTPIIKFRHCYTDYWQMFFIKDYYCSQICDISNIVTNDEENEGYPISISQWRFKKKINVTASTELTNHIISFRLHRIPGTDTATDIYLGKYGGPEFRDILIYDNSGNKLPYYLEEWTNVNNESLIGGVSTTIFINIPTINTTSYIFIYFGNPDAINLSNPEEVFLYYDNFLIHGNEDKSNSPVSILSNSDIHSLISTSRSGSISYNNSPAFYSKLKNSSIPKDNVSIRLRVASISRYAAANIGIAALDKNDAVLDFILNPMSTSTSLSIGYGSSSGNLSSGTTGYQWVSEIELSISTNTISFSSRNSFSEDALYGQDTCNNGFFNSLWSQAGSGIFTQQYEQLGNTQKATYTISEQEIESFAIIFGAGTASLIVQDISVSQYSPETITITAEAAEINGDICRSSYLNAFSPAYISFSEAPQTDPSLSLTQYDTKTPSTFTITGDQGDSITYDYIPGLTTFDNLCFFTKGRLVVLADEASFSSLITRIESLVAAYKPYFEFEKYIGALNEDYIVVEYSYMKIGYPKNTNYAMNTGIYTDVVEDSNYFNSSGNAGSGWAMEGYWVTEVASCIHEIFHLYHVAVGYHFKNSLFSPFLYLSSNLLFGTGSTYISEGSGGGSYESPYNQFYTDVFAKRGEALITYDTPGSYTPSITDTKGNTYGLQTINIFRLTFSYSRGVNGAITFLNTSSDDVSFLWDFGDGTTSTEENPVHTYSDTTTSYKVFLTGILSTGEKNTVYGFVTFTDSKIVAEDVTDIVYKFTYDNDDITQIAWIWDFGDGKTSTTESPVHKYTVPGTYTVKVSVTSSNYGTYNDTISITIPELSFLPVIDSVSVESASTLTSKTITCTPNVTQPISGTIASYSWDFGDGGTSTVQNPSHSYTKPGIYTLTLTVMNSYGLTKTYTKSIVFKTWSYHIDHTITAASELTDYQVQFTIYKGSGTCSGSTAYCSGNCNDDFSDIRFSVDGVNFLPYWIESYTSGVSAIVWVKIPTISTTGTTISLYYGNSSATDEGDGDDVFVFFDDFTGSILNTTKWTDVASNGVRTFADGILSVSVSGSNVSNCIVANTDLNAATVITGCKLKVNTATASDCGARVGLKSSSSSVGAKMALRYSSSSYLSIDALNEGVSWGATLSSSAVRSTWYIFEMRYDSAYYFRIGQSGTWNSWFISPAGTHLCIHTYAGNSGTVTALYDWIYQRQYAAYEPTHGSWGSVVTISEYVTLTLAPSAGLIPQQDMTFTVTTNCPIIVTSFGDGESSSQPTGTHAYAEPGTYTLVTNGYLVEGGDIVSFDTREVTIGAHQFSVTVSDTTPDPNQEITYTIVHTYKTVDVDFGDSSAHATTKTGTHSYQDPGSVTMTVKVYHASGELGDTITKAITVNNHSISLTASPSSATPYDDITFTMVSTYPKNSLSFGDGITSSKTSVVHEYNSVGTFTATATGIDRHGSTGLSASQTITIAHNPITVTGIPTGSVLVGTEVSLTITSNTTVFSTDFGDGYVVIGKNPSHTYETEGEYTITITGCMSNGRNVQTLTYPVTVIIGVEPSFYAKKRWGVAPFTVQFINTTDSVDFTWLWDFGDGTTSTEENPVHTYTNLQNYSVKLTATSNQYSNYLLRKDYIKVVEVESPVCDFETNLTGYSATVPATVQFTDASTGTISSYSWDFGDGETSTEQDPIHTYSTPGVYLVTHTVKNASFEDEMICLISVKNPLSASIVASCITGYNPLPVSFRAVIDGTYTRVLWDFGDDEISTDLKASHTYPTAGTYTVTLTVWNGTYSTSATKNLIVKDSTTKPVASFTTDVSSGQIPLAVQFTDASIGTISSYSWDFGDGETSIQKNPTHTFSTSGTFTVTLTVTGSSGVTSSSTATITALTIPVSAISASADIGHTPLTVTFTDKSTNAPTSWLWNFGDGTTSTEQNPTHTFTDVKSYWVTLTATNEYGSTSTGMDITVLVALAPLPSFTYSISGSSFPLTVTFTGSSGTTADVLYLWDFGDGTTSTEQSPVHVYYHPGEYLVSLTVSSDYGDVTIKKRISNG